MSLYTSLVSRAIFPLHERLKGHNSARLLRQMEKSQWWDRNRLDQWRLERLRRFLSAVGRNVPYYWRIFDEVGFSVQSLNSLHDLAQLPLLSKKEIRENTEAFKADNAPALSRFNTGGSTGEPLIFYLDKERVSHDVAAKWRATRWWDVDIGDPEIVFWGSPIELGAQDRIKAMRDRLLRTKLLPAFEMSPASMDGFLSEIRRIRPKMLFGYPSALSLIASHAQQSGELMDDAGIEVAFVTSECLYDDQRQRIERVFGCRVANGYGGRDSGFIAHQCPYGGMHITAEDIIVETIDGEGRPASPGQPGEVVVTHLATGAFPFIRYRTGDIAVLDDGDCPCGRGLPMIKDIHGRATDFIIAADGTVMHGLALIYVIRDLPGVEIFKIIQESLEYTRILLVATKAFDKADIRTIRDGVQARLGAGVRVDVERVDHIAREASGKFRHVISKVDTEAVYAGSSVKKGVIGHA